MKLYPYQEKIFEEALSAFKSQNRLMIVIPTGGGKTVVFSHLVKTMGLKTLIVAHTKELITQCEKTLQRVGAKNASVQTIQKCYLHPEEWDDYEMLIVDECHRSASPSYLKLIDRFRSKKLLGVTATPFRSDGQWLLEIYGKKIAPLSLIDMIDSGLLADFEGYRVKTGTNLKGISRKNGDFVAAKLASVINVKNRNELIVREYQSIAPGEKAICFAANIAHCNELAREFQANGVKAVSVHGLIAKCARSRIIEEFKQGTIKVLISCQILTEGFDEPSVTCLLMARPTLSKVLYMQMIGRGSRLFPGKKVCKVVEFTDNSYDVSALEQLIAKNAKLVTIERGERLSEYMRRAKPLLDAMDQTIVEKFKIVEKVDQRLATPWQVNFLKSLNVTFSEPLTEIKANQLIAKAIND